MVLIASTRAHMSEANTFAYLAGKGGLVALTHSLAITLGPDVRVNCISPGWINVDANTKLSAEDHAQHPAGRVGTPSDIAAAVAFLLSEAAGFMTAAELIIDGGMTRKMIYVE
jgi:NAD(P)-dependent dehydrogenase (short-subunit alcohol dehydrogenase family)